MSKETAHNQELPPTGLLDELMVENSRKRAGLTLERIAKALERIADRYELNSKDEWAE